MSGQRGRNREDFLASEVETQRRHSTARQPLCSLRSTSVPFHIVQFSSVRLISASACSVEGTRGPRAGAGEARRSAGLVWSSAQGLWLRGRMLSAHLPTSEARRREELHRGAERARGAAGRATPLEPLGCLPVGLGYLPCHRPLSVTDHGGASGCAVIYRCFS